jgi:hypothetical protein
MTIKDIQDKMRIGEYRFSDELLRFAKENAKPKRVIKVPVFDFAERA